MPIHLPYRTIARGNRTNPSPAKEDRSQHDRLQLAIHFERQRLHESLESLPKPMAVYAVAADFVPDGGLKPPKEPRTIHRLERGEITKPREVASPGSLSCITPFPLAFRKPIQNESLRRAALAEWLVDPSIRFFGGRSSIAFGLTTSVGESSKH